MDVFKVVVVVSVTLALVILINLWIYYRFSKPRDHGGSIKMLRKAARRGTAPWEDEDKKLQQLDALVRELKGDQQKDE